MEVYDVFVGYQDIPSARAFLSPTRARPVRLVGRQHRPHVVLSISSFNVYACQILSSFSKNVFDPQLVHRSLQAIRDVLESSTQGGNLLPFV